jgi:quercetin dioxygenase-like cupin family protein
MSASEVWIPICPGLKRKTVALGEKIMQVYVILDAGARMPEHSHVHEQICTCISGKIRLIVSGVAHELSPGESFMLQSNVPHAAQADVETHVVDTFSPPRQDMLKLDAEYAGKRDDG